ncbi:MAG: hypothetical protein L6R40_004644 [Gallowayella cf. fulva]|nr:MAG: hypothetical protein L6R40_004644 [Xanthomendoza cf. fulva]
MGTPVNFTTANFTKAPFTYNQVQQLEHSLKTLPWFQSRLLSHRHAPYLARKIKEYLKKWKSIPLDLKWHIHQAMAQPTPVPTAPIVPPTPCPTNLVVLSFDTILGKLVIHAVDQDSDRWGWQFDRDYDGEETQPLIFMNGGWQHFGPNDIRSMVGSVVPRWLDTASGEVIDLRSPVLRDHQEDSQDTAGQKRKHSSCFLPQYNQEDSEETVGQKRKHGSCH